MIQEKNSITVKIMGKTFSIKCPPERISDLHEAAKYLDEKINEIHSHDKVINIDNLVVITALNISHELLAQKKQNLAYIEDMNGQINNLQNMVAEALAEE